MGAVFSRLFQQRASPSLELDSLPENVLVEIFIRLPPHPAFLRVISLTCTRFREIVKSPDFLRLFRAHHGDVPPLVGFIRNQSPRFFPMLDDGIVHYESDRVVVRAGALEPHDADWIVLCCRHGRVLLQSPDRRRLLIVDPMAGRRQYVDAPSWYRPQYDSNAVMVCTGGHGDCRSRSFRIVFIYFSMAFITEMSIYSSETKQWSQIESNKMCGPLPSPPIDLSRPSLRIGNVLYCLTILSSILCFNVDTMEQYEISVPPGIHRINRREVRSNTIVVAFRDGSLGFLSIVWRSLYMWVSNFSDGAHLQWIRWKAVMLDQIFSLPIELIPLPMSIEESPRFQIIGYDDDENVVYIWTIVGVFALQVDTMKYSKVLDNYRWMHRIYPYKSFFLPAGVNGDGDFGDVIGH